MDDKRFAMAICKPLGELRPHAGNKIRKDQSLFDQRRQARMGGAAERGGGENRRGLGLDNHLCRQHEGIVHHECLTLARPLSCLRQACTRGQARLATPSPRGSARAEFPPYDRGPVGECFQLSKGALARQILHSAIRRGDDPLRGQEPERGSETLSHEFRRFHFG